MTDSEPETEQQEFVQKYDAVDWDADNDGFQRMSMSFDRNNITIKQDEIDGQASVHTDEDAVTLVFGNAFSDSWECATDLDPDAADELAEQLHLAAELAREGRQADVRT